ncbi:MAG: glucose-1-phosphate thymidylyltransferase [Deltaproteobacteria bacterium]|nr:MAG: glucose-1-phosphate thymidylyltransferase [Deltaproteobacteria bacterium]
MRLLISDDGKLLDFAPLTLTRPVSELRIGLLTIRERWEKYLQPELLGYETASYLSVKYPPINADITVNATALPTRELINEIIHLSDGQMLMSGSDWIAKKGNAVNHIEAKNKPVFLKKRWDLFKYNGDMLRSDFELITAGRTSETLSATNTVIGDKNKIFVEEGASIEAAILNVKDGPIYIGKAAEVMEGAIIRGPFGLLDHATIKMGAKMYGDTTIGPYCKVGGEIGNSIFYGFSNKGHDGYVGNSLIGEWCNLGADTNTSNLKNNYGRVKTFDYNQKKLVQTDVTFMGLSMGDHSKTSINTMFNTASTTGVFVNVFQAGFPDKFLPSFSWGQADIKYDFDKAVDAANAMMERRSRFLSEEEIEIFRHLYEMK